MKKNINWKLILISLVLLAVVVLASLWAFPDWGTGARAVVGGIGAALPTLVDLLLNAKKLLSGEDEEKTEASGARTAKADGDGAGAVAGNVGGSIDTSRREVYMGGGDHYEGGTHFHAPKAEPFHPLYQIPDPPRDFTGREEELERLCEDVRQGGVAISGLRGMGGIGKTALALRLAKELKDEYPDAHLYLDLRGAGGQEPLPATEAMWHVVTSFQPEMKPPTEESTIVGFYQSLLRGKKAIFLLDNARDAAQVEPLLPPEGCLALVTSRQHFALPGMKSLNLNVLPEADAVGLLLAIHSEMDRNAARTLAARCGCLPQALRVTASTLKERPDVTPEEYAGRLADLKTQRKELDEVQASLRLSYDLLPDRLQAQFRALAIFPTSFFYWAATEVWGMEEGAARETLGVLLRYSLVEYNSELRRYSLHDLVRGFADGLLSEEERVEAGRCHAEHYRKVLAAADQFYLEGGESIKRGLALFDLERLNIETGQAWASARVEQDEQAARLCSSYPAVGVYCLDLRLSPRERIRWLKAGLVGAGLVKDVRGEGNALGNLGNAYADLGEVQRAIEYYEKRITIAREIGDRRGEGNALGNLGNAYAALGEVRRAIEYYEKALTISREIGDRRGEGAALGNLGNAYADLGEVQRAIEYYEKALTISREIGDRRGEGNTLGSLGVAYKNLGEVQRAIEYHEQALIIDREIGDRRGEGNALGSLGIAYKNLGEVQRAIEYYEKALTISREIGDRRGEGAALGNLGNAYADLGEVQRAIEYYEKALTISREIGDRRGEGNTLGSLGVAYKNLGEVQRAIEYHEQALIIDREIGDRRGEGTSSWNLGRIYVEQGELEKAIPLMEKLVEFEREIGHPDAEKDAAYLEDLRVKVKRGELNIFLWS